MTKETNDDIRLSGNIPFSCALGAGVLSLAFLAQPAQAQTKIEQMIVTAQKRSQDIQTVPASISAFSGDVLEQRQIKNIQDLTTATPNISLSTGGGSPVMTLSIRGVAADGSSQGIEQPVALHIDGVYQPRTMGLNLIMSDLEAVEVLRGPQGTVYGRNANAGVINLVTRKPSDTFEGSATLFGGSYGRYGAKGYVSGPVADNVSMRLSALIDRSTGYGKNLYTGKKIDGSKSYGARLSVRLRPTEDLTVDLAATRSFTHSNTPRYITSGVSPAVSGANYNLFTSGGFDTRFTGDPHRVWATFDAELTTHISAATATASWDILPNVSLKSITGWQRSSSHSAFDADAMPINSINSYGQTDARTFTQEFNLNAKLWDRLDLVAGLYYMNDKMYNPGLDNPFPIGNPPGTNVGLTASFHFATEQVVAKAVFLDTTFSVTDELRIVGGIRKSYDDKSTILNIRTLTATGVNLNPTCGPNRIVPPTQSHSTTYRAGIQYDITPDVMAYVQWQNGFKGGGYNYTLCSAAFGPNAYKPEYIYSWEAGIKSSLFDNAMTLNISVFDYRYSNLQIFRTIPPSPTNGLLTSTALLDNAASAKIRGAEIEVNGYFTDDLKGDLGIGILDSEFGDATSVNALVGPGLVSIKGNSLPKAPRLTISAGLEYTTHIGGLGELKSRGEYSYTSRTWYSIFNEAISRQDGYSTWNAAFTLTPDVCDNVSIQVFAKNLTDKNYRLAAFSSAFLNYATGYWGAPRTFGAEITAKF